MTPPRRGPAKWKIAAVVGPVLLLVALGAGLLRDPSFIPSARIADRAPLFDLAALDGDGSVSLAAQAGKVVVVNFWASWCGACRTEHDVLVGLGRAYADDPSVAFIGVNFRDRERAAHAYLEEHGAFPYPSGRDPHGRTGIDYGVYGLPETFFIGEDGQVLARHVGALNRESAQAILADLGVAR